MLSLAFSLMAEDSATYRSHTVVKGETLYSISRSYQTSQDELLRLNGLSDPSKIFAGQILKIPPLPASNTATAGTQSYIAVKGDSLYGIARSNGITVDELKRINGLSSSYVLKAGDKLLIPGKTAAAPVSSPAPAPTASAPGLAATNAANWPINAQAMEYTTGKLFGVMLKGSPAEGVKSLTSGAVLSAGPYRGFGKVVVVRTNDGYLYVYSGCETLLVKPGDSVAPGTELGILASVETANPELFFMVYKNSTAIDPAKAPRA
jgi:LysM repeat protein